MKKLKIEDIIMFGIIAFAVFYPLIIALIIYRSDRTESEELLKPLIEYLQDKSCPKRDPKNLVALCRRINDEGYSLRSLKTEDGKAVLFYGKKVKGLERKLKVEVFFEGDKITDVRYEEGD